MSDPKPESTQSTKTPAELTPLLYADLRRLARSALRGRRGVRRPTGLVHEAYIRLQHVACCGRTHFLAIAATQMRRILVEEARAACAQKRGGGWKRVPLSDALAVCNGTPEELLTVHEALDRLAASRPRQAEVAELRLFAGMTVQEVASHLGVSERTVKNDWRVGVARLGVMLESRTS